jgi:hypothetical protein
VKEKPDGVRKLSGKGGGELHTTLERRRKKKNTETKQ